MLAPMGSGLRLSAVLRAGESRLLSGASYSGAPNDNTISYAKNAIGAPGDPPKGLKKAASAPAAPAGFVTRKGPAPGKKTLKDGEGNQAFQKSSEVVKDLVAEYKREAGERADALRKARKDAELCAERRVDAVNKFRDAEAKAASDAIGKLEGMLKEKEAALDKLQSASDESLAKLDKMTREGGESSKQADAMKKAIAQLEAEKKSVEDELAAKKKSCDEARDAATKHEAAELAKMEAAWKLKLDEALAKAKAGDVASSKELAECTGKLEKVTDDLEKETKAHNALTKSSTEKEGKFKAAAKAACDALKDYTK